MPLNNTIKSIKDYFSSRDGVQRSNRFSVSFTNTADAINTFKDTEYIADEFILNKRAIDMVSDNLVGYGLGRAVPRRQRFADGFVLGFPVTGDNKIMLFFNDWFNKIYGGGYATGGGYPSSFNLSFYDDIVRPCDVTVNLLDMNGTPQTRFLFTEVTPAETLPIKMTSAVQNEYLRFLVVFNYRDFKYDRV